MQFLRTFRTRDVAAATVLALAVGSGGALRAQQDQGAITGVVKDSSGAVVAGAEVTLTNTDQGISFKTNSNGSGVYLFSPVKIGNYSVRVSSSGFEATTQENLHLNLQQRLNVDISLKTGSVSDTVVVNTAPPLLQTEEASVGQVLSEKTLNETPLNGRNWVFAAQLTAGVAPSSGARGAGTGDFSANGARSDQNNFILDGVDNNVNVVDFLNGASFNVQPPPDALAEVRIQTSSYSAEFGHSSGAVVNASIKSGTNSFHGSLWEYFRNDILNTKQYFDQEIDKIPEYRQNIFGGTIGGPVYRNKLFFFADVQGNRVVHGNNEILTVPTTLERLGDFSELLDPAQTGGSPRYLYQQRSGGGPNPQAPSSDPTKASPYQQQCNGRLNVLCPGAINPIAQKILNLYPLPNRVNSNGGGLLNSNYTAPINNTDITAQYDARIDYNPTVKDQAFARFSYQHEYQFYPPALGPILDGGGFGTDGNEVNIGENIALSETHVFTDKLLNELRFGFNYGHFYFTQPNASDAGLAASLGLNGIPGGTLNGGLPNIYFYGQIAGAGSPNYYPSDEHENIWQALDNVTLIRGNHSLRLGVNIQHIRFATLQPPRARGNYNYNGTYSGAYKIPNTGFSLADFLSDNQHDGGLSSNGVVDDVRWDRAGYVQDDWKVSPRFTLNVGLRLENQTPYFERHGRQAAFYPTGGITYDPSVGQQGLSHGSGVYALPSSSRNLPLSADLLSALAADNITVQYTDNPYLIDYQKLDWSPRVGLSYKLDDKTVVRAGFGIFFGGLESIGFAPNLGLNYPFFQNTGITSPNNVSCLYSNGCPTNGIQLATGYTNFLSGGGLLNAPGTPTLNGTQNNLRTSYNEQFNLSLEKALGGSLTGNIAYVGTISKHTLDFPGTNSSPVITPFCNSNGPNGQPTNLPCDTSNSQNPFSNVNLNYQANDGIATYNGLQTKLDKRFGNDISFLATYTWSHQMTNAGTAISQGDNYSGTGSTANYYIFGVRQGLANGPEDVRHRFTFNSHLTLPVGRGHRLLNNAGIASQVLGGWETSLTEQIQTGEPFTVGTANFSGANNISQNAILIRDPFQGGGTPDPSLNYPAGATCPTKVKTLDAWFNPCAFKNPLPGSAVTSVISTAAQAAPFLGDHNNTVPGPGYNRTDMSLFKSFPLFHESQLQFRADIFNLLNTPAFILTGGNDGPNGAVISPGSYRFFQNNTPNSRFFQLSLKLTM